MMRAGSPFLVTVACTAATLGAPALAHAVGAPILVSSAGSEAANGASGRPALSGDGQWIAFDSAAGNLAPDGNGNVRDVFLRPVPYGPVRLVSAGAEPADGPSHSPAVSADGSRVAFVSSASNLVPDDSNGVNDVFIALEDGSFRRVNVPAGAGEADLGAHEPDISGDGRFVVFTTRAGLVDEDTNERDDIYVRDVLKAETRLVSGRRGKAGNGRSRAPSISPDGGHVSFFSSATTLVRGDRNGRGDVFLADLHTSRLRLVTRSSRGRAQNRSVQAPFPQYSDVSRGGRFVVFDSDADNLVPRDRNGDTDVFRRDMLRGRTVRVSLKGRRGEAGNDSVAPVVSLDGRHVAFQSFARDMAPGDPFGEDVFLRDVRRRRSGVMGRDRGPELVEQLLQRPSIDDGARWAAFTTTATGLSPVDDNGAADVYVRRMR